MDITLEKLEHGYRVWKGKTSDFDGFLLANITTRQHGGRDEKGEAIHKALNSEHWVIHFTSPHMSLDELKAVAAILPTTP